MSLWLCTTPVGRASSTREESTMSDTYIPASGEGVSGVSGMGGVALGLRAPAQRSIERGTSRTYHAMRWLARTVRPRQAEQQHGRLTLDAARVRPAPMAQIRPDDPIVKHFTTTPVVTDVDQLPGESPTVQALRAGGVRLVVPLVSQGELVGMVNLGPRLSEEEYSTVDRSLLNTLSAQAAPALRVAQLVREQQAEARERERLGHELRVARLIQQTLLPKELPSLPGWQLAAHYRPARAVGGDFYDFVYFPDGKLGIVIGDVTDKGVPAALVMATTRSILRSAAQDNVSPGAVLRRANDLLCPDIPASMFVTCFYAVLDPTTGRLRFANAGHDLPYQRHDDKVTELHAAGMPLGLMPDMRYAEGETMLAPGDSILLYSDGLVEAHNPRREMFGFGHLAALLADLPPDEPMIDSILTELEAFTGPEWEQEDDVTLVTVQRHTVKE